MTQTFPEIEQHPLTPFLPHTAKILMLGSFPPQQKRWSMHFYYPNFTNDMWRIMGFLFYTNKDYFVDPEQKTFKKEEIVSFCTERGIALYDTATAVRRLQDNASDKFLEIVVPTDVSKLLQQIPLCKAIITTGQKAAETLCAQFNAELPKVGEYTTFIWEEREMRLYRMPSSSRAYPMKIEHKAAFYKRMMQDIGLLHEY